MKLIIFYFPLLSCLISFGYICGGKESSKLLSTIAETSFDCKEVENSLIIKGDHIKFSEFTTPDGELKQYCKDKIKSLTVFALDGVTIDRNIRAPGIKMFVLAPIWKIIGYRRINLDGEEHPKPQSPVPKKKDVTSANTAGVNGAAGLAGNRGGTFVGVGDEITNGEALTISVSGGDGQDGGDGGDGSDGINGLYANKDKIDLNCYVPSCHEPYDFVTYSTRNTESQDNTGKLHTFYCNGSTVEWVAFGVRGCTFILYGENGQASGNGGNSGPGGKRGNPGNILLLQLGEQSGIKTINNVGKDGRDGEAGKAGEPGSHGPYAYYRFSSTAIVHSTPKSWYEYRDLENGHDGEVDYEKTNQADPYIQIDFSEVSNVVVEYKGYLLENIDLSDPKDFKVVFFNKIDKSKAIRSMFDTLALVNELRILEKSFHKGHNKYDFLPLYQSLSNRTLEYAKKPNGPSTRSLEHRKVLTYLYTTLLSREYNVKDRSESNLIVDLSSYLDMVLNSIKKYKESNKVHVIEEYRKNYEENIHIKINEANNLIKNDIMPELEKALKENTDKLDIVIDKILKLEESAKKEMNELQDKKNQFQNTMILSLFCDHLKFVGKIASVIPEVGGIINLSIDLNVGMFEDVFQLNKEVTIPPPNDLFEGAQASFDEASKFKTEAFTELSTVTKSTITSLIESSIPKEFNYVLTQLKEIEEQLAKGISDLTMLELSGLRIQLNQIVESARDKIKKAGNIVVDVVKRALDRSALSLVTGLVGHNLIKKWNEKQAVLNQINEAIESRIEYVKQLKEHENKIRNEALPALETMSSNVLSSAKSLGGKSQVSLDVTKWKMQSCLRNMQSNIQALVKGLNVTEVFANSFEKVVEALNTLIAVYGRIESFQEDKKKANYIADIQSAGSHSIKISDGKLRNAIDYLDLIINCNTVVQQYQTAVDAFKQYVFPFANLFFAELVLPSNLNYGEDLDGLVIKAETQINHIKKKFDEYRFIAKRYDSYIGSGNFNSKYRSTRPFFVWDRNTHGKMISQLLSGKKVIAIADVKKSNPRYDAVKFNEIEFNFKATDQRTQSALTKVLKDFKISAYHTGNSYFRSNDQYFLLVTGKLEFWYSFEKDRNGQPVEKALLIDKIKNGAHMLSPYTSWEIQLTHFSERNRQAFEVLNKYKQLVDIELIGQGHFVFKDKLDIDIKIEEYYTPLYNETKSSTR